MIRKVLSSYNSLILPRASGPVTAVPAARPDDIIKVCIKVSEHCSDLVHHRRGLFACVIRPITN